MRYSLKKATSWNLAGYIYLLLVSFITTPPLIRALGVQSFGAYTLAIAISAVISACDMGLSRAVVYHLIQSKKENRDVLSTSFVLYTVLAFVYAIPLIIFHSAWLALFVAASFLLSHAITIPESKGDFARVNLRNFIVGTANTVGALMLARMGYGVSGILGGLTLATLGTWLLIRPKIKLSFSPETAKILIRYGAGSQMGKIVGQLEGNYAKFLLASSPIAVSSYGVGSSLVTRLVGGITQMSTALFPHSTMHIQDQSFRTPYHRLQVTLIIVGVIGIVLYQLIGERFIMWWLGPNDVSQMVHAFLSIFRYYGALLLLTPLSSTIVDAAGKPMMTSLFGLAAIIIEVALAVMLVPRYGVLAPAYGGVVSLVVMVPIFLWYTEKTLSTGGKSLQIGRV